MTRAGRLAGCLAIIALLPVACLAQGDGMGDLGLGNLGLGDMNLGNMGGGGTGGGGGGNGELQAPTRRQCSLI